MSRRVTLIVTGEPSRRFRATTVEPVTLSWLLRRIAAEPASREAVLEPGDVVVVVGREEPAEIRVTMPVSPHPADEEET